MCVCFVLRFPPILGGVLVVFLVSGVGFQPLLPLGFFWAAGVPGAAAGDL